MWTAGKEREESSEQTHEQGMQSYNDLFTHADIRPGTQVTAFLGKESEIKGQISYGGTILIDGSVEGEVKTDGVLLIGADAVIKATIHAATVICKGKVCGDIVATEKVNLLPPTLLQGSVKTPKLIVEEGVILNGRCEMASAEVYEFPRKATAQSSGKPTG